MYNRYIPQGDTYKRVLVEEPEGQTVYRPVEPVREDPPRREGAPLPFADLLFGKREGGQRGLSGLLRTLKLEKLDSGDILLLLIVLYLLVEGDHLELVIALGLVLVMGLGADESTAEK